MVLPNINFLVGDIEFANMPRIIYYTNGGSRNYVQKFTAPSVFDDSMRQFIV